MSRTTQWSPGNRRRALRDDRVRMGVVIAALAALTATMPAAHAFLSSDSPEFKPDCLVVLHGLLRTERNTAKLAAQLDADYDVLNFGYNSRKLVDEVAENLAVAVADHCADKTRKVHFAAHSMGSIVVRRYLETERPENLGRVVMLGPPNGGSELVDRLPKQPMRWIAGLAALQLGTDAEGLPATLKAVDYEVGVIAGGRSVKLFASRLIPGDDDGLVAIERTRVDGMLDHIVMPVHHQELVKSPDVAAQVAYFISNGAFDRTPKK